MRHLRFYHSFRSPYSRLGLHVLWRAGIEPELVPFTGPPEGSEFLDAMNSPAKMAYVRQDVVRMTKLMKLELRIPENLAIDFGPSYRASVAASLAGRGMAFALSVYEARWARGLNIADLGVLSDCAMEAGLPVDFAEKMQSEAAVKQEMRRHRELIEQDQAFGVPLAVAGKQKYWGHERIELMLKLEQLAVA